MSPPTTCARPGCGGPVDDMGYCENCGHEAARPPSTPARPAPADDVEQGDPLAFPAFTVPLPVAGDGVRWCVTCRKEPDPRASKYCPECATPLGASLRRNDLVGDQYKVRGFLARGGQGETYLAQDVHLDDNDVVLKGHIAVGDSAVAERRALTTFEHPNIVRIYNFVTHPDAQLATPRDYIVMEYVGGLVLADVMLRSRTDRLPWRGPLTIEHVIMCGLQILAALQYLHGRGYLYCDLNPNNVILRSGGRDEQSNRVKLIDFGGVRRIGDRISPRVGTTGFVVSDAEIAEHGLTVRSDLHTVGVTLQRLHQAVVARPRATAAGRSPFVLVYERARHQDPRRRFASATEMAGQLDGVLREIASLRDGRPRPRPSAWFERGTVLLDGGLGRVPGLERWTTAAGDTSPLDVVLASGPPEPTDVAIGLPEPKDPTSGFVAGSATDDQGQPLSATEADRLGRLTDALDRCRADLAAADPNAARADLAQARILLDDDQDWRSCWHAGLIALWTGEVRVAAREFDAVYRALPGEDAPKLALAYCAEAGERPDLAESFYEAVWRRDPEVVSALFGLVRIRLGRADRAGAVALLDTTTSTWRHTVAVGVAAVQVLCGNLGDHRPTPEDLRDAADRLTHLNLDDGAKVRLETVLREARLARWLAESDRAEERAARRDLETSYLGLARQSRTPVDHTRLIDLANRHRPVTHI